MDVKLSIVLLLLSEIVVGFTVQSDKTSLLDRIIQLEAKQEDERIKHAEEISDLKDYIKQVELKHTAYIKQVELKHTAEIERLKEEFQQSKIEHKNAETSCRDELAKLTKTVNEVKATVDTLQNRVEVGQPLASSEVGKVTNESSKANANDGDDDSQQTDSEIFKRSNLPKG